MRNGDLAVMRTPKNYLVRFGIIVLARSEFRNIFKMGEYAFFISVRNLAEKIILQRKAVYYTFAAGLGCFFLLRLIAAC